MEPEVSLSLLQVPATCPYPEPARSSPQPHIPFPEDQSYYNLPRTTMFPKWFFLSGFSTKTLYMILVFPLRATCSAHLILLDSITRTILVEKYRSLSFSLCSFLHFLFTSYILGPNILLNNLFPNTITLRFSLNVSNQVSHPYKTTGNIIVLYI